MLFTDDLHSVLSLLSLDFYGGFDTPVVLNVWCLDSGGPQGPFRGSTKSKLG